MFPDSWGAKNFLTGRRRIRIHSLTRYILRSRSRSPRSRRPSGPDPPPAPEVHRRPPQSPEKIRRPPKSPEKRRPPPTSEGKGPPTAAATEAPSKDDLEAEYRKYKERTEARIRREKEKLQRYESRIKQLTHLADGMAIFGHLIPVHPVLRIRDVYPGSRILIFTHPGSRPPDLGSRIQKQQQKRGVKKKF